MDQMGFLQAGGFVVLVTGTLIYNEVVHLPCLTYPDDDAPAESSSEEARYDQMPQTVKNEQ